MTKFYDQREGRSADQREQDLTRDVLAQLVHARDHTVAYREIFHDVDLDQLVSLGDIESLPITRKSELLRLQEQNPPFGGFVAVPTDELEHIYASPGPIYEPQSRRPDYWRFARSLYAAGIRAGDLVHNTFSYHMTPAGSMCSTGCLALGATVVPGGVGQTDQQLQSIARLQPQGYCGTPSFLKILLDKADETGMDISCITKALVSGEAFPGPIRKEFNERKIHALQCYATADLGLIAYESSADSGLIIDEDIYLEIVRSGTGDRVPDGEVGEVIVTTLNPDYPLIRFATGDMSAIMAGTSACGRTNRRIKGWMGRADQTAKVRGMFIHPEQIDQIVKKHPEIDRVRLVVQWINQADNMILYCETNSVDQNLANGIADSIRDFCKVRGDVKLVTKGSLANDGMIIEDIRKYE